MRARFTAEAREQLNELTRWWRGNRTKARPLRTLVREAVDRVKLAPYKPVYVELLGIEYRRALVATTPYHLYYFIDGNSVVIVAVWSGEVDEAPPLG